MCSTPRASGSMKKVHRLPTSKAHFKSQSQMMRRASEMYDKKEQDRAKQREQEIEANKHSDKLREKLSDELVDLQETTEKVIQPNEIEKTYVERFSQFLYLLRSKIPPIVTT